MRNPLYRRYFLASGFATLGVWMTRFLYGWMIWEITESFFWVGVASSSLLLPSLVVTPIFGVISDRINLRTGVIVWLIAQASVTLLSWAVFFGYQQTLPWLLTMTFLFGCIAAAGSPLRLTLIPKLVTQDELPNAVGWGAMLFNSSRILAPALAAVSLQWISPDWVFILCTALFGCAALINAGLPAFLSSTADSDPSSGWQDFVAGLRYCWSMPMIQLLFLLTLTNSQVARALIELLPALSGTLTAGRATDLAFITGSAGAGSILGGWYISRQRNSRQRLYRILMLAMTGTCVLLVPLFSAWPVWALGIFIAGISGLMTLLGTGSQILLQLATEDSKRGRVMSLWLTIALAGPAIGALLMGTLAEWAGMSAMLSLMILISLLSAIWLAMVNKRVAATATQAMAPK